MISITFGSNRFIDSNGIIAFKNKELFKYELRSSDLQPMITVEIRDSNEELLGKVWKSSSFVHCHKDYEAKEEREGNSVKRMSLIRKSDNATIFELNIRNPNDIEISGVFHVKGFPHPIIATKDFLKIGGITLSHNTIVRSGKGIMLSESGFSI